MKWERHAEFLTLTLVVPSSSQEPDWSQPPKTLMDRVEPFMQHVINA